MQPKIMIQTMMDTETILTEIRETSVQTPGVIPPRTDSDVSTRMETVTQTMEMHSRTIQHNISTLMETDMETTIC